MPLEKLKQRTNKQIEKCGIVISTDQNTQTSKQNDKHRDHNSQTQVTEKNIGETNHNTSKKKKDKQTKTQNSYQH